MKGSNNLTSHNGESRNRRADKMSSEVNKNKRLRLLGKSKRFLKDFYNSKRRMMLKNFTLNKI